jgi:hypothetical protein
MNASGSAIYKGIDFSSLFFGALTRPVMAQVDKWDWIKWPYWNYVFYTVGGILILLIILWIYSNWIR